MLKSSIYGIKLITNSERLVYVLWFASGSPSLSGRRCLSISRVAYTWNPTVSRVSTRETPGAKLWRIALRPDITPDLAKCAPRNEDTTAHSQEKQATLEAFSAYDLPSVEA